MFQECKFLKKNKFVLLVILVLILFLYTSHKKDNYFESFFGMQNTGEFINRTDARLGFLPDVTNDANKEYMHILEFNLANRIQNNKPRNFSVKVELLPTIENPSSQIFSASVKSMDISKSVLYRVDQLGASIFDAIVVEKDAANGKINVYLKKGNSPGINSDHPAVVTFNNIYDIVDYDKIYLKNNSRGEPTIGDMNIE